MTVEFANPHAEVPSWYWRMAPPGYATRRQLREMGLRPGGQDVAGILIKPRSRVRAELFRIDLALPKRTASPAWYAATRNATRARMVCHSAHHEGDRALSYIPPRRTGYSCLDCS